MSRNILDFRRVFRLRERPVNLREAWRSRMNQILWHTRSLLLLFALRRWLLPPSSDFSETLTVSNSAEFRSFLLNMCMLAPESTTNVPSSRSIVDGAGKLHSLVGEKVALSVSLSMKNSLANLHASPRAHRSCLSASSWDPSSNFKALGLRWRRTLTWNFPSDGPLFSSDVCMTLRSLCESYSSNWSQDSCALPWKSMKIPAALSPEICNPTVERPSLLPLHFCHHPASAFCWVVPHPSVREASTLRRTYIPIQTYRINIREDANGHKVIWSKYLSSSLCTAVDLSSQTDSGLWGSFVLDALLPRVFEVGGSEGGSAFGVGFARSLLSCRKLHWSPFEQWPSCLPLLANSLSPFITT